MGEGSTTRRIVCGLIVVVLALAGAGCSARPPRNVDDTCTIFEERHEWYRAARKSYERWGIPIHVQLAIIHQESRFRGDAKPSRRRIFWLVPGPRPSSAEGYTQALTTTWDEYTRDAGNWGADRDDFGDATDFIGWYCARSARGAGISKDDAFRLYLAYHEGDGGFRRGTYRRKPWLLGIAWRVQARADLYARQLTTCAHRFGPPWWRFWSS